MTPDVRLPPSLEGSLRRSLDDRLGALRPRSSVELIDATFVLTRAHYGAAVGVAAPMLLPYLVLELTIFVHRPSLFWVDVSVWYASVTLAAGAAVHVLADAYHGRELDPRRSLIATARRAPALLAATALKWAFVLGGLLVLVVPGIFLFASLFAVAPVILLEGPSVSGAVRRSYDLAAGGRWRIVIVLTVVTLLLWVAELSATIVLGWISGDSATLAARVFGTIMGALMAPLAGAVLVLLYYDQRMRREGYDLEILMPAPGPASNVAARAT